MKFNSVDLTISECHSLTTPPSVNVLNIEKQVVDSSNEKLILSMSSVGGPGRHYIALLDYSTSVLTSEAIKQILPVSTGTSSRFIMHFDHPNQVAYYICGILGKVLFFSVDMTNIELISGIYTLGSGATESAGDITKDYSQNLVYISQRAGTKAVISIFDPDTESFKQTLEISSTYKVYGVAADGDDIYLSINKGSGEIKFKYWNLAAQDVDPDTDDTISNSSLTMSLDPGYLYVTPTFTSSITVSIDAIGLTVTDLVPYTPASFSETVKEDYLDI